MHVARRRAFLRWTCFINIAFTVTAAAAPDRDKDWDALIAAAKAHGAEETKLDRSSSYVFQRPDGSYLTFTRMLDGARTQAVCLISQGETATACVDWDNGKLQLGKRADAATPRFYSFESLDAFEEAQPGLMDKFVSAVNWFLSEQAQYRRYRRGGCRRLSRYGNWYYVPRNKC